ncbi:MAG: hypothetical protein CBC79_06330 [Gammaproteobacteria bacterium TMED119]|nr:MAG: hypothetical protein CBC79_06330 [Gammaproteobacteria bacterium TMED119]RCL46605.1 MAG: DUF2069 domain-containing protein [Candidatus Thioglobus sp.]
MYYLFSLISYFSLMFGQIIWLVWLNPNPVVPTSLAILFLVGPLLFALRGLLHNRLNTFKWVTLFVWLYFTYGIWNVVSDSQLPLGLLQIITSLSLFVGAVMHVRSHQVKEDTPA